MSPEQACGLRVDPRSDIFSFGGASYEMLAGVAPFRRATPADTLGAILNDEPGAIPSIARTVPGLDRILHHCLEKKPENRFQSVRDIMFDFEVLQYSTWAPASAPRHQALSRQAALIGVRLLAVSSAAAVGYVAGKGVAYTTNIWALSTAGGTWRQLTDFGERAVFIARRVSWTADGRSIVAAIGEGDADIIYLMTCSSGAESVASGIDEPSGTGESRVVA
jgi:hypothetical protein